MLYVHRMMYLKVLSSVGAAQGIETVRRDNCLMVRKLATVVLDKLLKERDPDGAGRVRQEPHRGPAAQPRRHVRPRRLQVAQPGAPTAAAAAAAAAAYVSAIRDVCGCGAVQPHHAP